MTEQPFDPECTHIKHDPAPWDGMPSIFEAAGAARVEQSIIPLHRRVLSALPIGEPLTIKDKFDQYYYGSGRMITCEPGDRVFKVLDIAETRKMRVSVGPDGFSRWNLEIPYSYLTHPALEALEQL